MAANTVYVQGPYVDVHDNEVVNLSVDKAGKVQVDNGQANLLGTVPCEPRDEELCHFVHPSVDDGQEWFVHDEVKRLVSHQSVKEICRYLLQMRKDNKVLLPESPSAAYGELVRMGMPNGEGFNESTFRKYYSHR